jgi:1-acyl-sn-glycerol-3-phosphate acyltransferase
VIVAGVIRLITGAQARWCGVDPVRPDGAIPKRVYFANHQSNLDAPVIWASLPRELRRRTRPVAAQDYWDKGPLRRLLAHKVFRCLLIERKKVTVSKNPLRSMERVLDDGDSLIIFPEGTRSMDDDGTMNEFKPGLWHLGKKHPEAELVPVHLENLNRILPKGTLILIPLLAAVTFGTPIKIEEGEDKPTFLVRAKKAVEELHPDEEATT